MNRNPFSSRLFSGLAIFAFLALFVLLTFARVVIGNFRASSRVSSFVNESVHADTSSRQLASADPLVTIQPGDPEVVATDPKYGASDPVVTIIEFGDFECPFCAVVGPRLKSVVDEYPDQVQLVWKDFPVTEQHAEADDAAVAARCAQVQGQFWGYHDLLYQDIYGFSRERYESLASELGLDLAKFQTCLDSGDQRIVVDANRNHALSIGINGTPFIFVNDREFTDLVTEESIKAAVEEEIAQANGS